MRILAPIAVLIALCASVPSASAQSAPVAQSANNAVNQLRIFLKQTKSATGQFEQSIQRANQSAQANKSTKGDFAFARPGKFSWQINTPYELLIVGDGKQVWQYDKDLNQATVRPMTEAISATPAALLFGDESVERKFTLSPSAAPSGDAQGLEWLTATPVKTAGVATTGIEFSQVLIGMKDGLPQVLELKDGLGQVTKLRLSFKDRNSTINPQTFSYTPAKGVDVVKAQ